MVHQIYEVWNRPVYGPGRWWCIRSKCVPAPEVAVATVMYQLTWEGDGASSDRQYTPWQLVVLLTGADTPDLDYNGFWK